MFKSTHKSPEQRLDVFVARARAAREAGKRFFQVYLPDHDAAPDRRWLVDYETTHVVEALESEGWTLENVGHAVDPADDPGVRMERLVAKAVGTIYTFRAT